MIIIKKLQFQMKFVFHKFNENEVKELFGSRAIIPKRGKKSVN